ncbi:MAG: hypothetical protein AMXMBFR33_42050 [Candidatus Xenobia bacterium]
MPADLGRVLNLINRFVLERLQVDLAAGGDRAEIRLQAPALHVRHEQGEGLLFEDILAHLTGLPTAPPKGNPVEALIGFQARLNTLTMRLMPELWPRLASFLGQSLAARGGRLVDRVVVQEATLGLGQKVGPAVPVRAALQSKQVRLGELECVRVEDVSVRLDDFVPGKDMKAAVEASTVVVESLKVRVFGSFLTRAIDTMRDQIPSLVENFALSLSPGRLTISGTVRKILAFNFAVDLRFAVSGQELMVQFERFSLAGGLSMPGWLRSQILGVANKKLAREKAVRIVDDVIYINPRKRIPPRFKVAFDFSKFTVEGNDILLELVAPPDKRQAPAPSQDGEAPASAQPPGQAAATPTPGQVAASEQGAPRSEPSGASSARMLPPGPPVRG